MAEFVHDIDEDDLDEYRGLIEEQTVLEMKMLQYQSYLEQKYLAGTDYEDGNCYVDWSVGAIYLWEDE